MNGPAAPAPRLLVRMACGLYEGLLLFGVLAGVGLLYGVLLRPTGEQNWGPGFSLLMLAGADADDLLDRRDEDLAVADLAGLGGLA
jgi:hypothetical protein